MAGASPPSAVSHYDSACTLARAQAAQTARRSNAQVPPSLVTADCHGGVTRILRVSRTGRRHPHREGRACEFRGGRRGRCFLPFGFHLGVIIRCFNTALSPLVSFSARRSFGAVACEAWQVEELVHEGLRRLDAAGKVGEPRGAAARAARLDRRRARVRLVPC